jgi:hypothetical protein
MEPSSESELITKDSGEWDKFVLTSMQAIPGNLAAFSTHRVRVGALADFVETLATKKEGASFQERPR